MKDIAEQAKQTPANATPLGWDNDCVRYPGVNTCMTFTCVPDKGPLVGLHFGLNMYNLGSFSEMAPTIDTDHIDLYLWAMSQRIATNKTASDYEFFLAGAASVWSSSHTTIWKHLNRAAYEIVMARDGDFDMKQFDDREAGTVDIYVDRSGVKFTKTGTDTAVTSSLL